MPKISRTPPKAEDMLVEVENPKSKHRTFRLFRTHVEELGSVEYQDRYAWVCEDGVVLRDADAAEAYLKKLAPKTTSLKPGTEYEVSGVESITQARDRVIIKTARGDVVIRTTD